MKKPKPKQKKKSITVEVNRNLEIAQEITRIYGLHTIYETIHQKNGGYYQPVSDNYLERICKAAAKKALLPKEIKKSTISEIKFFLGSDQFFNEKEINPSNKFNFKNGELVFKNGKVSFEQHQSIFTFQSQIEVDLKNETIEINNFLDQVLDSPNSKAQILEALAIAMFPELRFHCNFDSFIIAFGRGSNGKTILFEIILKAIFEGCMEHLPIEAMEDKFPLYNLLGKRINVCTENNSEYISESRQIKSLTSGDSQTIERKHKQPFSASIFCSMIFSVNKEPNVSDILSYAMKRRMRFINFPFTFSDNPSGNEKKSDPDLKDLNNPKIKRLQKGLIVLIAQTAERLFQDKKTTVNDLTRIEELQLASSHHRQFVSDCLVFDPASKIESKTLFDTYVSWCINQHSAEMTDKGGIKWVDPSSYDKLSKQANVLTQKLIKLFPAQIAKSRSDTQRFVTGIKLKDNVSPVSKNDAPDTPKPVNPQQTQTTLNVFGGKVIEK